MNKVHEEHCYLCKTRVQEYNPVPGEKPPPDQRTRDHIPPRGLFPDPKPSDLITAICCYRCNESFSKLDDQFRAFVSMAANVSEAGRDIMRSKVFSGSLKRSPKLKAKIARNTLFGTVKTVQGPITGPMVTVERSDFDPFFIRITKGLLATFYPSIDYFPLHFSVTQLNQFSDVNSPILKADQRGNGVFRFWHGVVQQDPTYGLWVYQFYDAARFLVRHGKDPWPQGPTKGASA